MDIERACGLVGPQPVQSVDMIEGSMIPERHLNDLANLRRGKEITFSYESKCHIFVVSQDSLAAVALQASRDGGLDVCCIDESFLFLGGCPDGRFLAGY